MAIREIRKRDGRREPYDETKISGAIFRAAVSADEAPGDAKTIANEVAAAVTVFLNNRYRATDEVTNEDIHRMVENVLTALSKAPVARAYTRHRAAKQGGRGGAPAAVSAERNRSPDARPRATAREAPAPGARPSSSGESGGGGGGGDAPESDAMEAAAPRKAGGSPASGIIVESDTRGSAFDWDTGRIASALVREARLSVEVARHVAAIVEQKAAMLGLARMRTALVRELVDSVLVDLGFGRQREAQAVIGVPKFDLERLLFPDQSGGHPEPPAPAIAGSVLRQYALQEVFTADVAREHLAGALHIHGLEAIDRLYAATVPLAALAARQGDPHAFLTDVAALHREISGRVHHRVRYPAANFFLAARLDRADDAGLRREAERFLSLFLADGEPDARQPAVTIGVRATPPAALARAPVGRAGGGSGDETYGEVADRAHLVALGFIDAVRALAGAGAHRLPAIEVTITPDSFKRLSESDLVRAAAAAAAETG
ncbi:MAG: hypothetical protein HY719_15255, partial [Planctomycetes bacterium]|nr:hypothetical protein [Planctomycetota bacterium]